MCRDSGDYDGPDLVPQIPKPKNEVRKTNRGNWVVIVRGAEIPVPVYEDPAYPNGLGDFVIDPETGEKIYV